MSSYVMIFVWLAAMVVLAQYVDSEKTEYVMGRKVRRMRIGYAVLVFLPVIIWAGLRDSGFGDTGAYMAAFRDIPATISEIIDYLPEISKDKGFTVLSGLIKMLVGDSTARYFLVLAAIQGIALLAVYREYSTNYLISVFLFVASTDWLSWMFNGIRQFTAASIIFAATGLMLKKKYIPTILIILLAATIHGSALLMIPFVFIAQGKAWNKKTILFIAVVMLAFMYADRFTNILDTLLSDTQYENVVSDWQSWNDDGTSPFRVLVYAIPTILAFVGKHWIDRENDPIINFCTNMSIASTGIYLISMVSSGIFIGRLPIYFSLYNYILLPWEIEHFFTKRSARIIMGAMIVFYLVFYYYQMHYTWGLI